MSGAKWPPFQSPPILFATAPECATLWCNGIARRHGVLIAAAALLTVTGLLAVSLGFAAEPGAAEPNYLTSPYHGMRDGNGRIIPCRCRFQGRDYPVGEIVCMSTHLGTVLTRCDLAQNNTTWIPSNVACEVSDARSPWHAAYATTQPAK